MTHDDARDECRRLEAELRALQAKLEDERESRRILEAAVIQAAVGLDIPRWEPGELIARSLVTLVGKIADTARARGELVREHQEAILRLQERVRELEKAPRNPYRNG